MNRPAPISVFSDQHRTKSTTRSRTSCGTHTWVRAPQDFFLKRCARPSTRPTPRPWSGSSFPGMRFVVVRLGGPGGPCLGRRQRRSRRTLFASGRIPLAATPVPHTDRKSALCPTSAVSGWQPSLLRCSAFSVFPCVLSVILTEERPLQFQLRQDSQTWHRPHGIGLGASGTIPLPHPQSCARVLQQSRQRTGSLLVARIQPSKSAEAR